MRNYLITLIFLFLTLFLQAGNFRPAEMEIRVFYSGSDQVSALKSLKLQGEYYSTNGIFYVTPTELDQIRKLGFEVEILREDLAAFAAAFWQTDNSYYSYPQMISLMDSLATHFPAICQKVILGQSAGGRELAILKISDNVTTDEAEPEVYFEGGIHGDELIGPELVIRLAREMILGYGTDPQFTTLINTREIWMFPLINPDGRVSVSRYNDNGVDVNRDWGYMWGGEGNSPAEFSQPETRADFEFLRDHQFVVYTSYHGGTEYISFPWSYRADACPDFSAMNTWAGTYASVSGYAAMPYGQGYTGMYAINGSTKDAVYGSLGAIPWSLEVSMEKQPPASEILMYYGYNKPAMLQIMEDAGKGIAGMITDSVTGAPVRAAIVVNNGYPVFSDPVAGDFHKYLLPGTYSLKVIANGYHTKTISNVILPAGGVLDLTVSLSPDTAHYAHQVVSCMIPGNNFSDEGYTPAAIGPPDGIRYSLGKGGNLVMDMQDTLREGPGPEIRIIENDAGAEGYQVFGGSSITGPWLLIGSGNGSQDFDFSGSGLLEARYIRILDDNDGPATANDAGFDLDAIQVLPHPDAPYLMLSAYHFSEQSGNGNNTIDPGETIEVFYTLLNNGSQAITGSQGILNTTSPWVTLPQSGVFPGDILTGQAFSSSYLMEISSSAVPGSTFSIQLPVNGNNGAYSTLFSMHFPIGILPEDWESGTFTQFDWQSIGVPWTITTSMPHQGIYCARSGQIGHSQNTDLQGSFLVLTSDSISFYRKVSSEEDYDFLKFFIDGNLMGQWSGNVPWGRLSYPVGPGHHTFLWRYSKDSGATGGSDAAWIDDIALPPVYMEQISTGLPAISVMHGVRLIQNPVKDRIRLHFTEEYHGNLQLTLYSVQGSVISRTNRAIRPDQSELEWNLHSIPAGMYYLSVGNHEKNTVLKVMVE